MEIDDKAFHHLLGGLNAAANCKDDIQREGNVAAFAAFFLDSIGVDSDLLKPLWDVADRNRDVLNRRWHGNKIRPHRDTLKLVEAAVVATMLVEENGAGRGEALRQVAERLVQPDVSR